MSTASRAGPIAGAVVVGAVALAAVCVGACVGVPCVPMGLRYGAWVDTCPVGAPRLTVDVDGASLLRGDTGTLTVDVGARYVTRDAADAPVRRTPLWRGVDLDVALLDADGGPVPGLEVGDWERGGSSRSAPIGLPDVPDGDYVLRVTATTRFDRATVDVPLPLYTPAVAHLMTDRPLYKPGQTVLLRSVLLQRTDLAPLDGRPGRWVIRAPDGTQMLAEEDRAGAFGVADTTFPLDRYAQEGRWTARWESGDASDQVTFDVRPFRLPRLSVDVSPTERWFGVGDELAVEGTATYTSGAPVADAPVRLQLLDGAGPWPIPIAWEDPIDVRTDAWGRFTASWGEVPGDLIERDELRVRARVTEVAGEVAVGSAVAIVSADDLAVDAVTELGDGLVGGFNNRAYLRVATPDGRPLPGAEVVVGNPWDPTHPSRTAVADADGVVAVQVDPGDPVTVVDPEPPVRVRPLEPAAPSLTRAMDLLSGPLSLAERRGLDDAFAGVAACGDLAPGGASVTTAVRVSPGGSVVDVQTDDAPVSRCVAAAVRQVRLPEGTERTLHLEWSVPDSLRPSLVPSVQAVFGATAPVAAALEEAGVAARRCLARGRGTDGAEVVRLHWRIQEGQRALAVSAAPVPNGHGLSPQELECVRARFAGLRLRRDAPRDDMGTAVVRLDVPRPPSAPPARSRTRTAYELAVTASVDGARVGATRLVLPVGTIPALRLRATPSLAHPGDTVTVELLRGPTFTSPLPATLVMYEGTVKIAEAEVDPDTRTATFTLPPDRDGFFHVDAHGARAVLYVAPEGPLALSLTSDRAAYRPGETAKLTVRTAAGDAGQPAGVGLVGVDQGLGQLAPLLGPDDLGRVTVRASSDTPAFDVFDARALALGQVRGENAAKAAVLRVSSIPTDAAGDTRLSVSASTVIDDQTVLLANFYRTFTALVPIVRAWEASAPEGEVMTPDRMVAFWAEALDAAASDGGEPVDAFGRRLELVTLPPDLLAQVDPRRVVADGTRLPEDVIGWEHHVATEVR